VSRPTRNQRKWEMESVALFGKRYSVIERLRIRQRTYLLLDRLSTSRRERYLAFDPYAGPNGAPVAILRLPRSQASRQHVQSLQRRAGSNENFPAILDYDEQGADTVVVLKWLRGVTLAEYLGEMQAGRRPRISSVLAFQRVAGLAHGVSRWHNKGQIVHGDIKPENIIVSADPGRFALIDFGSAWVQQAAATREIGDGTSSFYSAPEQEQAGAAVNERADQFALSVVLYQLLTFTIPYDGLGGKAGRPGYAVKMAGTLVPPSRLAADRDLIPQAVWRGIDRVVTRGLAFDPDERYPTPQAWLDDLDSVNLDIKRPVTISGTNRLLTQVIGWIGDRFRRN